MTEINAAKRGGMHFGCFLPAKRSKADPRKKGKASIKRPRSPVTTVSINIFTLQQNGNCFGVQELEK
jgi:hypothetical protein